MEFTSLISGIQKMALYETKAVNTEINALILKLIIKCLFFFKFLANISCWIQQHTDQISSAEN